MSKQMSTVIIGEPVHAPGQFFLIRTDFPDPDREFVWCGPSLGWLPANATAHLHRRLYRSVEAAQEDVGRYVTWPLRTEAGELGTCLRQIGANQQNAATLSGSKHVASIGNARIGFG